MADNPRVRFFFVGVGKSGTSWLYTRLAQHPDLSVPKLKEPYLIDKPASQQAGLISSLYSGTHNMCDFSTLYYWDAENADKIHSYNPDAQIIITLRKPSDRIRSHFGFLQRNGGYADQTLAQYLAAGDPEAIVARSDYSKMIQRYQTRFGQDAVLLLPMELLVRDPQAYIDRLTGFLNVASLPLSEDDRQPVLKAARARSTLAAQAAKFGANSLRRLGLFGLLGRLKTSTRIRSLLFREIENSTPPDFGPMTETISAMDADYLSRYTALWQDQQT